MQKTHCSFFFLFFLKTQIKDSENTRRLERRGFVARLSQLERIGLGSGSERWTLDRITTDDGDNGRRKSQGGSAMEVLESRGRCLGSVWIVGLLAWVQSKLWVASPGALSSLPPLTFIVAPGLGRSGFVELLPGFSIWVFWFVVHVFLICCSWFDFSDLFFMILWSEISLWNLSSRHWNWVFKTRFTTPKSSPLSWRC